MARRLTILFCLMVASAACDGSSAVTTIDQTDNQTPTSAPASTTSPVPPELRPDFVAWVAPVDFDELRLGWEATVLPARLTRFHEVAECWEANGFSEFAGHVRDNATVLVAFSTVSFPDMGRLRESGLSDEPSFWVDQLLVVSGPDSLPDSLRSSLAAAPDIGLNIEDLVLIERVGAECNQNILPFTMPMGIPDTEVQWITVVTDLDGEPDLAGLIEGRVMPCLRGIDPYFGGALDPGDWLSRAEWAPKGPSEIDGLDSERWAMPDETLVDWGQAFASCMEPLEVARRAERLAARETWVGMWHAELLAFQAEIDAALAGS